MPMETPLGPGGADRGRTPVPRDACYLPSTLKASPTLAATIRSLKARTEVTACALPPQPYAMPRIGYT